MGVRLVDGYPAVNMVFDDPMYCRCCGCTMDGDGYTSPVTCEFADVPIEAEADSGPWYCSPDLEIVK